MTIKNRVDHIISKQDSKEHGIDWATNQIGRKLPKEMNPDNLPQSDIDSYWLKVIDELKRR